MYIYKSFLVRVVQKRTENELYYCIGLQTAIMTKS